ncbi:MAG: [protein-PII] uridylyltransferase [Alphaproteobacteria bacterium]|nr:MAG: [protein-PII] uridylyltransferase [Alphaproteobacteria bacterium]
MARESRIRDSRAIFDRAAAREAFTDAIADARESEYRRAVLEVTRGLYQAGMAEIRRRHEAGAPGRRSAVERSWLIDGLLAALFEVITGRLYRVSNPTDAEHLAIAATGGYGRGELAPHSDIDLLFLYPYRRTGWHERVIEFFVYTLWDLGLKVGHAVRSHDEALKLAREDLTIRTALLDLRAIAGETDLVTTLERDFRRKLVRRTGRAFVEEKLAERDARHARMGDTRYVVEPNLKEGKGGLRDLHTLYWITDYLYGARRPREMIEAGILEPGEARAFERAEAFFWTVRVTLHFMLDRAEERLTFDVQPELARRLGYRERAGLKGVERFMKHYFLTAKTVGDLTRILCAVLEERNQKSRLGQALGRLAPRRSVQGFRIEGRRLTFRSEGEPADEPRRMIEIFAAAQDSGLDIHPQALRLIARNLRLIDRRLREDEKANAAFLEVLMARDHPEINLRRMNEAGVLGRFVPDFGRIVAQMQYDMYHHYTVDEHTIRAIGLLAAIERGDLEEDHPLSTEVIHKVKLRRSLYLGVFLHDIAKGRGGDHSELGERIARKLGPRLGLAPAETDLAAWLVRHHLLMSMTAFQRDLSDPQTIEDFAEQVSSPERLRQLLVLTVADIRAVGPGVWNSWKAQLLRELFWRAEERLIAGHAHAGRQERVAARKRALAPILEDWPAAMRERLIEGFTDAYWIAEDDRSLAANARLLRQLYEELDRRPGETAGPLIELREDPAARVFEVSVVAPDRPGLFARLTAAFALAGVSIVGARIHTSRDRIAVDNFRVAFPDSTPNDRRGRTKMLEDAIRRMLCDDAPPPVKELQRRERSAIPARRRVFKVEPVVLIDDQASRRATVIEINATDRPGLLHDLAAALAGLGLDIRSAHVSTYGERAVDVFYVTETDGRKVAGRTREEEITRTLLAAAAGRRTRPAREGGAKARSSP